MLALACEQVELAQADLVSISSAFGQVPDAQAAQEANKENEPPATPAARGHVLMPRHLPHRVCSKPFTLSWVCV